MHSIFLLSLFLYGATPALAFWRLICDNPIIKARMDPVVSPNAVAGHVHTVSGGSNFSFDVTFDGLRASECTSCEVQQDMSNYWTPLLYYQYQDGSFQDVTTAGGLVAYYLQRGDVPNYAFPPGFRMLAGNPKLRTTGSSLEQQAINFVCLDFDEGANSTFTDGLPNTNCPAGLRAQVVFPSCWDGVNLDPPDHKSHMAYPSGVSTGSCPPGYPKRLVTLFYEVTFQVDAFKNMWWNGTQSPFVFAQGDPTGFGFHGDFVNGWDVAVLQNAIDTCTASSGLLQDCPAFTLKSGQNCHQTAQVDEIVTGKLAALPGCNPVTWSSSATPSCPGMTTPQMISTHQAYEGNVVPPNAFSIAGTPKVMSTYKTWTSMGCMSDPSGGPRVLPNGVGNSANNTVAICLDACQASGYKYAGLEYAGECYCGDTMTATQLSYQSCDMPCHANSTQLCGGSNAIQVYSNNGTSAPQIPQSSKDGSYNYVGCYLDNPNNIMPGTATNKNNTIDGCIAACAAKQHSYAGIEYGANSGNCFCGDSALSSSLLKPDTDCNMKCAGDSTEFCGGSWRLQVYNSSSLVPIASSSSSSSSSSSTKTSTSSNAVLIASPTTSSSSSRSTSTSTPTSTSASTSTSTKSTTTSSTPTPTISIPKLSGKYKYVGCYTEVSGRALQHTMTSSSNGTVDSCVAICASAGYTLAGLEYGGECYCDNVLSPSSSINANGDAACNKVCSQNSTSYCGAGNLLQLYNSQSTITYPSIPQKVGTWSYTGCYTDTLSPRSIPNRVSVANQTVESCTAACASAGYTVAGVEYGGECYCSSSLPTSSKLADSQCNKNCNDNVAEYCGAGSTLQVYQSSSGAATTTSKMTMTKKSTTTAKTMTKVKRRVIYPRSRLALY